MWRSITLAALILSAHSVQTFADDKKQPPLLPLADEAAKLAEKSKQDSFWRSGEVTLTRNKGQHTAKGKLVMFFTLEKGKPTGWVSVRLELKGGGAVESAVGKETNLEFIEKDGKRFMKINLGDQAIELEYTIRGDELIVKGGVLSGWAGWDVDLSQPTSFKSGNQVDDLQREVKELRASVEELQRKLSAPELKNLQGTWKVSSLEGAPIPAEQLEGVRVTILNDKITVRIENMDQVFRCHVDPTTKPAAIDIGPEKQELTGKGIYELTKDTLKICIALEGEERPKEFLVKKDKRYVIVLQRLPK